MRWNHQGNRKLGRPKSTWKRELHMNLIRRSTKLSVKPQQLLLPKKMERPCAWPRLYIEINGNGDNVDIKYQCSYIRLFNLTFLLGNPCFSFYLFETLMGIFSYKVFKTWLFIVWSVWIDARHQKKIYWNLSCKM